MTIAKAIIVFMSPAGTTRRVARRVFDAAVEKGGEAELIDLARTKDLDRIYAEIAERREEACLFVGSPVYVSHALPPVMEFIGGLPENTGAAAALFVTWGGATSGVALHEMGEAMIEKGMKLAAAAKITALHSMMWKCEEPLGKGKPDSSDDEMIANMVGDLYAKLESGQDVEIDLSRLAYLPEKLFAELTGHNLEKMKPFMPERKIDESLCNQCGVCADVCPTQCVSFQPYPEFGENCVYCYNCVRLCPENAIECDFSPLEQRIRDRSRSIAETPPSHVFI